MEFIAAKCPNCAGELRLPDDKKQVKCMYCGFDVFVRKAISAAGANVENWLKLASTAERTGNYAEAYKYFTQVLEYEPDNYTALLGKGVNAGYLSTPYKFRSVELMQGVRSAIENAPENKKQEITLQAAEEIVSICLEFDMDDESNDSILETANVVYCLNEAHEYAPENERIITQLYLHYRLVASSFNLLNSRNKTDIWNEDVDKYTQKANESLSKLQAINPEKAADFIKSETESETETEKSLQANEIEGESVMTKLRGYFVVGLFGTVVLSFVVMMGSCVGCTLAFVGSESDTQGRITYRAQDTVNMFYLPGLYALIIFLVSFGISYLLILISESKNK